MKNLSIRCSGDQNKVRASESSFSSRLLVNATSVYGLVGGSSTTMPIHVDPGPVDAPAVDDVNAPSIAFALSCDDNVSSTCPTQNLLFVVSSAGTIVNRYHHAATHLSDVDVVESQSYAICRIDFQQGNGPREQ